MIVTLGITLSLESVVVTGYSFWRKKPFLPMLLTSICGNLVTQSLLWIGLSLFFQHYLITLFVAETLIWLIESVFLYWIPANRLRFIEAVSLSLTMNLSSFAVGWFLRV